MCISQLKIRTCNSVTNAPGFLLLHNQQSLPQGPYTAWNFFSICTGFLATVKGSKFSISSRHGMNVLETSSQEYSLCYTAAARSHRVESYAKCLRWCWRSVTSWTRAGEETLSASNCPAWTISSTPSQAPIETWLCSTISSKHSNQRWISCWPICTIILRYIKSDDKTEAAIP